MASIEEKVENLIRNTIENLNYELYDVQYVKEGKEFFLRVFIDQPKGISIEDCEIVSNHINDLLDEADYIKEQYFLEVSSPGIERVLRKEKHFQASIGKMVEIKLFQPIQHHKMMQGILTNFSKDTLIITQNNETVTIERKNIAMIKTVYQW